LAQERVRIARASALGGPLWGRSNMSSIASSWGLHSARAPSSGRQSSSQGRRPNPKRASQASTRPSPQDAALRGGIHSARLRSNDVTAGVDVAINWAAEPRRPNNGPAGRRSGHQECSTLRNSSEGMGAYSGDAGEEWKSAYKGAFKDGFGPHCDRVGLLGNDYEGEVDDIIAPGGVFDADGPGQFATMKQLMYRGRPDADLRRATPRGKCFVPSGEIKDTHKRCVQHQNQGAWNVQSSKNASEGTQEDLTNSLGTWMRGQTLSKDEREKRWRRWQRRQLRASGKGGAGAMSSAETASVMPAGLQLNNPPDPKEGPEKCPLNIVTWGADDRYLPADPWAVSSEIRSTSGAGGGSSSSRNAGRSFTPSLPGVKEINPMAEAFAAKRPQRPHSVAGSSSIVSEAFMTRRPTIVDRAPPAAWDAPANVPGRATSMEITGPVSARWLEAASRMDCEPSQVSASGVSQVLSNVCSSLVSGRSSSVPPPRLEDEGMLATRFAPAFDTGITFGDLGDAPEKLVGARYQRNLFVTGRFVKNSGAGLAASRPFAY